MTDNVVSSFERWLKLSGVALTLIGLAFSAYQYTRNQAVDAARPYLERKLKLCAEAVEVAAGVVVHGRDSLLPATTTAPAIRRVDRFWELYWGMAGMVGDRQITVAMIDFANGLKSSAADTDSMRALSIAHACSSEMALDWSPVWKR
jgi:hypothetical protein